MHGRIHRKGHFGDRRHDGGRIHYGKRAAGIAVAVSAVTLTLALPAGATRLSADQLGTAQLSAARLSAAQLSTSGTRADARAMSRPGSPPVTITLITGDKVTVGSGPGGRIIIRKTQLAPRAAGAHVALETFTDGSHTYVVPTDALHDFAAGTLDRQLFDVAYLSANGYADSKTSQLPVIVQYRQPHMSAAALGQASRALPAVTATPTALTSVNGAAVRLPKARAAAFWRDIAGTTPSGSASPATAKPGALEHGLARVWLDAKVTASDDVSDAQIGAPAAWAAGYDGTGVNVGIIDTGIDPAHPDLAGKVAAAQSFVPASEPGGGDPADVTDRFGHGTHVASIIAGTGAASAGRYKGVAPGAGLVIAKGLDDSGSGLYSTIIAAMQWEAATEHAKIVNMSIGGGLSDGTDPLSQAVDDLTAQDGTLFVVAAGNSGSDPGTINAPGAAAAALTVAAVDSSDKLAWFSSQGPTINDYALKPDIAAPGVSIIAARAAGTSLGEGDGIDGDGPVDAYYTAASGTSMATPHVAGAAAILAEQHPNWGADQLKDTLMSTAADDGYTVYQQGAGRVNVARAVSQNVDASTTKLDYGEFLAGQTSPVTKTVSYTNFGGQAVTLDLTGSLGTVDGQAAPAGTLSLSAASITVPANGTAQVSVTLDPSMAPGGIYSGYLHATDTADGIQLATPVGYAELDQVNFSATAPAGTGAYDYIWVLTRVDKPAPVQFFASDGLNATQDLVPGTYSVTTFVVWNDPNDGPQTAMLVNPEFTVAGSTQVDLSTSQAKKISVGIKDTPTEAYAAEFGYNRLPAGYPKVCCTGVTSVNWSTVYGQLEYWVTPTAPVRTGGFKYTSNWMLGKPVLSASVANRPGLALRPEYADTDPSIPKLAGRGTAALAFVHDGQPSDFQGLDLHGKIALLHVPPGYQLDNGTYCAGNSDLDAVTMAASAGAIAVLAYSDTGRPCMFPGPDIAASSLFGGHSKYAVPTATVTADEGRALAGLTQSQPAQLSYEGTPTTPDAYFLALDNAGQVPSSVTYSVSDAQLATVRARFHASTPSVDVVTANGFQPDDFAASLDQYAFLAPATIDEHYGPLSPSVTWSRVSAAYSAAQQWPDALLGNFDGDFSSTDVFTRPTSTTEDLGGSPVVPGPGLISDAALAQGAPGSWSTAPYWSACADCRQGNDFTPLFWEVGESPTITGQLTAYDAIEGGANDLHLYSGGQEIQPVFNDIFTMYQLPAAKTRYTLTNHYVWPFPLTGPATQGAVDTSWTFSSAAPTASTVNQTSYACMGTIAGAGSGPCDATPLIFLNYNLGLNLDNAMTSPGAHTYQVTAYEQPGIAPAPAITKFTLSVSYDNGVTWQPAKVTAEGNGHYQVTTVQPPGHSASFASIKAQAWDSAGDSVQQVITHAYSLGG